MSNDNSFWLTIPGILTGIAAIITAITGLLVAWYKFRSPRKQSSQNPGPSVTVPQIEKPPNVDEGKRVKEKPSEPEETLIP